MLEQYLTLENYLRSQKKMKLSINSQDSELIHQMSVRISNYHQVQLHN